MGLTFEHPEWLWLLAVALPVVWLGARWFGGMSRWRRWSAGVLRTVLVVLIVAMLAGVSAVRTTAELAVIGVVDVSGSVRMFGDSGPAAGAIDRARAFFAAATVERGVEDLAGLVVFDGRAVAVAMPTRGQVGDRSLDVAIAEGTDIGGAMRYAAALVPPSAAGRLVLVSDGGQNAGDALAAARAIGMPVDVVPIQVRAEREVMVESVDAPPRAAERSAVTVRVTLLATGPASGSLRLVHNGEAMDINGEGAGEARRVELAGGRHVELVDVKLPAGQSHRFRAEWLPDEGERGDGTRGALADIRPENNSGEAFTSSLGSGAVLVVDSAGGSTLARTLERAGVEVVVMAPEGVPSRVLELQSYGLIVLDNIPADAVSEEQQRAIDEHVRQMGAGLVMVGGRESLGAGGWKGSVIEPLLPVKLDLPERLVQPDAAVMLVLDRSGSMGRAVGASVKSQQEIANEAAAIAVRSLARTDLVGVVLFNRDASVLWDLAPNTDPRALGERIMSISPDGGTAAGPGLREARRQLREARAGLKHIVLMSDGRSMDAEILPGLAKLMRDEDGITVSTIGVGDDADHRTMAAMAQAAGGEYFRVTNPNLLPKFFLKAVKVVRTPLIREGAIEPVILPAASPLTAGLGAPPTLGGVVLTQRRAEPTITYAMGIATGEPLLAHWTVELGQVAVFASDSRESGWAERWVEWEGYSQMWVALARALARADSPQRMTLTPQVVGDDLKVRVDAAGEDGRPLDLLTIEAVVTKPDRSQTTVVLTQTGPGMYEGSAAAGAEGNYVVVAKPRLGGQRLRPVIAGTARASGVEFRELRTNLPLLERIAAETGGRVLDLARPEGAGLFDRSTVRPREARTPLWRGLLVWVIVVLLLDIATRRIAWDRFVSREFGVDLVRAASEAVSERGLAAARAAAKLKDVPRPSGAGMGMDVSLSDEDATRLAEEQAERRREQRMEALRAKREEAASAPASAPVEIREAAAEPEGPSDLMAAKRRAKKRFEDEGKQA